MSDLELEGRSGSGSGVEWSGVMMNSLLHSTPIHSTPHIYYLFRSFQEERESVGRTDIY